MHRDVGGPVRGIPTHGDDRELIADNDPVRRPLSGSYGARHYPEIEIAKEREVSSRKRDSATLRWEDEDCDPCPERTVWRRFTTFTAIVFILGMVALLLMVGRAIGFTEGCEDCAPLIGEKSGFTEGCQEWDAGICRKADSEKAATQYAQLYLHRGDSFRARGDFGQALDFYQWSIRVGADGGGAAPLDAARRARYLALPCVPDRNTMSKLASGFPPNAADFEITVADKKRALTALGYDPGHASPIPTADFAAATERFQRDLGYEANGVLRAAQTVTLICGAAAIGSDASSMNLLGTMHALGIGVTQSMDAAIHWFKAAASGGSADASWALATLFGTGMIQESVHLCDATGLAAWADMYFQEAYDRNHPRAVVIAQDPALKNIPPTTRWLNIKTSHMPGVPPTGSLPAC